MKINDIIKVKKHKYIIDTIYKNNDFDCFRLNRKGHSINKLVRFKL